MVRIAVFASACVLVSADWEKFKLRYGKTYNGIEGSEDSEAAHMATYVANMAYVAIVNSEGQSFQLGENQFSDLTHEQYKVAAGFGWKPAQPQGGMPLLSEHVHNGEELSDSVDWRVRGAVTGVKNQGQCASCWAFSTIAAIEGAWHIAISSLTPLSEQQLIDCSTKTGCIGGNIQPAISFESGVNVCSESSYPYAALQGICSTSPCQTAIPQGGVTGYKMVGNSDTTSPAPVSDVKSAIQHQPVSIAVAAGGREFGAYKSGVLTSDHCSQNLNHAVLAVGYGTENGMDYWLVKNSWGSGWGDAGYIKIGIANNACGATNEVVMPVVSGSVVV